MTQIASIGLATIAGASTPEAVPLDYKKQPFTLVYDGAIAKNETGKVNIHPVTYDLHGLKISANVYTPANYDKKKKYPAIVVAHPNGGVKEQTAGLRLRPQPWTIRLSGPNG